MVKPWIEIRYKTTCGFELRPSSSINGTFCPSVRLSVCPSVTHFSLCSHHRIFMKLSGVFTNAQGKVHAKGQGQRSKFKVREVNTQLNRFRTGTPVGIHQWQRNNAQSLKYHRRGVLLFLRSFVIFQGHTAQKSSNLTQIGRLRTVAPVWIHQWRRNDAQSLNWHIKGALLFFRFIRQISRSHC